MIRKGANLGAYGDNALMKTRFSVLGVMIEPHF